MKKLLIPLLFIGYAMCTQSCKKTATDSTSTAAILQAQINGTVWTPDTVAATITYNSATKNRVFYCSGNISQKQVTVNVNVSGASTSVAIPVSTYTVDTTSNVKLTYLTQQKNSSGAYVYTPVGTVDAGGGSVTISVIDTVGKTITGSFTFSTKQRTFDSSGNLTSLVVTNVTGGYFNAMPYKYIKN